MLQLGNDLQDDRALAILQNIYSLLVREAVQGDAVNAEDLVATLEASMLGGCSRLEDGLDVNWHVSVRASKAANYGESEAVLAPLQLDG